MANAVAELVHQCGSETTDGFECLPLEVATVQEPTPTVQVPVETVEVAQPKRQRKPRKAKTVKAKRGRGRPPVYNGTQRRQVACALRKYGYTKGLEYLRNEKGLDVSMTLARSVAEEAGLKFKAGRPKAA